MSYESVCVSVKGFKTFIAAESEDQARQILKAEYKDSKYYTDPARLLVWFNMDTPGFLIEADSNPKFW